MHKTSIYCLFALVLLVNQAVAADTLYLLKPESVFDGERMNQQWWVLVKGNAIAFAGAASSYSYKVSANEVVKTVEMPGQTLLPGFIEGHSHLFLHAYDETPWKTQVLEESRAERTARAVNHAYATLKAGFTTVRDLGTEGAEYDDVGLKLAIEKGIIPGPRMLVATKAIVATGSYAPKSASADIEYPIGAAEADGVEGLTKEIRRQMGKGADVIKLYGDYRWGKNKDAQPTFTQPEMDAAVEVAKSAGRQVVVHSVTPEGMKRAARAGVSTIEHGDMGDEATFQLMKANKVAFCPTISANEAVATYKGWKKGVDKEWPEITRKKVSFQAALRAGVTICFGGDVGVYPHGTNAREMLLMVEYGMSTLEVLRSATSVNADVFEIADKVGRIKAGLLADIVSVEGDPAQNMATVNRVKMVMKDGKWIQ